MTKKTCSTCRFWALGQLDDECRRYPPTMRPSIVDPKAWYAAFPETWAEMWFGCWETHQDGVQKKKPRAPKPGVSTAE